MGKAASSPREHRPRRYVSRHAVDRIRERGLPDPSVSDETLSLALDRAVDEAINAGCTTVTSDGLRVRVGRISALGLDDVVAVVKSNTVDSKLAEAIVTVLDPEMRTKELTSHPFAKLATFSPVPPKDTPPTEKAEGVAYVVWTPGEFAGPMPEVEAVARVSREIKLGRAARVFREVKPKVEVVVTL